MELEKTVDLLREEMESSIAHLDGYINLMDTRLEAVELRANELCSLMTNTMDTIIEMSHRLAVLEKEFNCTNETRKMLKRLEKELGLDPSKPYTQEQMKAKSLNGLDLDEGV